MEAKIPNHIKSESVILKNSAVNCLVNSKKTLKKPILWILDRIVIAVACGAIFVRIGNFINSEIIGKEVTDFPLGVQFLKDSIGARQATIITKIKDPNKA